MKYKVSIFMFLVSFLVLSLSYSIIFIEFNDGSSSEEENKVDLKKNHLNVKASSIDFEISVFSSSGVDIGRAITQDSAGNLFITGKTQDTNALLRIMNNDGSQIDDITWSGSGGAEGFDVIIGKDDFIYVVGKIKTSETHYNLSLIKFNPIDYHEEFNITWGGHLSSIGYGVAYCNNHLFIVGINETSQGWQTVLLKYNTTGDLKDQKTLDFYHSSTFSDEYYPDLVIDSTNNIYVVTTNDTNNDETDINIKIISYDENLNHRWNSTYLRSSDQFSTAISIDSEDNIYITGYEDDCVALLKYNKTGSIKLGRFYSFFSGKPNYGYDISIDNEGYIYIIGTSNSTLDKNSIMYYRIDNEGDPILGDCLGVGGYYDNYKGYGMFFNNITRDVYAIGSKDSSGDEDILLMRFFFETSSTTTDEDDDGDGDEPAIPGYDLLILISIVSVITLILSKKKFKK